MEENEFVPPYDPNDPKHRYPRMLYRLTEDGGQESKRVVDAADEQKALKAGWKAEHPDALREQLEASTKGKDKT